MFVQLTEDLERGFKPWKEMYFENEAELNALGARLVFAGATKEDDNKMMVIIEFDSPEAMKAFATHEELRASVLLQAPSRINVVTIMSDEAFTPGPDPCWGCSGPRPSPKPLVRRGSGCSHLADFGPDLPLSRSRRLGTVQIAHFPDQPVWGRKCA